MSPTVTKTVKEAKKRIFIPKKKHLAPFIEYKINIPVVGASGSRVVATDRGFFATSFSNSAMTFLGSFRRLKILR